MSKAESPLWFYSPTHGRLHLNDVVTSMAIFQKAEPSSNYRVFIGTDSLPGNRGEAILVTALVFHRLGNGGIYFWQRERYSQLFTLRQRVYQEALASIEVAKLLLHHPMTVDLLVGNIEIHVDVGQRGPTKDMIREIVGMVRANGFPVKTKPEAIAASSVADRHTIPVR